MCGRYASTSSPDQLAIRFDAEDRTGGTGPAADYNVAPTKPVYAVRAAGGPRTLDVLTWGLVPSWAKDRAIGGRLLNARAETVTSLPAFRSAFARRRCLVPADGWYEWVRRPHGPGKQPYFVTPSDGAPLAFAGLWEVWGPDRVVTCTVVTTEAHGALVDVHHRMPLVLPSDRWAAWLGEGGTASPEELLAPTPAETVAALEIRPVGPRVGKVDNNGPDLVTRCDHQDDAAPIPTLF